MLKDVVQIHRSVREALNPSTLRTTEESQAFGKNLRQRLPIEDQGIWEAAENRPDPIDLLRSQGAQRVQSLLPIRYQRMSASPFAFYRGTALIMAQDLSGLPNTGVTVQLCGDAHIANFGLFASPERRIVFDINDFDETLPGPWEWDVKRLATSVEICGRDRGFKKKDREAIVLACVEGYRKAMAKFATMGEMDVWYAKQDVEDLLSKVADEGVISKDAAKKVAKGVERAKKKDSSRAIAKFTEVVDGRLRIVSDPPMVIPLRDMAKRKGEGDYLAVADMRELISLALFEYRRSLPPERRMLIERYHGVDVAHKNGCQFFKIFDEGQLEFILLAQGASEDDYLVLQVKEAQKSVLEPFCGKSSTFERGQRVVEGQRAMQSSSDMLLGWCRLPDEDKGFRDYYVRQLWDGKGSVDYATVTKRQLKALATACGGTLARAHARTGDRFAIAGYLGSSDSFDRAIAQFAVAYADQNEADYDRFMWALQNGELEAKPT